VARIVRAPSLRLGLCVEGVRIVGRHIVVVAARWLVRVGAADHNLAATRPGEYSNIILAVLILFPLQGTKFTVGV
jgi:hypothetical protein